MSLHSTSIVTKNVKTNIQCSWFKCRHCNNNLTGRSLIIPCSLEYLKFPPYFFNTPITYFPKYFLAKVCEILTSGSWEIGIFLRKLFHIESQLFDLPHLYTCAAFNWVLSVTKKNLRIAGLCLHWYLFLTYIVSLVIRLKLSIHCIKLWRKQHR